MQNRLRKHSLRFKYIHLELCGALLDDFNATVAFYK